MRDWLTVIIITVNVDNPSVLLLELSGFNPVDFGPRVEGCRGGCKHTASDLWVPLYAHWW